MFKETALYGLSSMVGKFLNYLLVFVHTRYFMAAEYGQISEFYSYTGLLMVLFTLGLETGFFKFYNDAKSEYDKQKIYATAYWTMAASTLLLSSLGILFCNPIANYLEYPQLSSMVIILFMILAFDTLTTLPFAYLRQQNRPLKFVFIRLLNIGINILFSIFFLVVCPWLSANGYGFVDLFYQREWGIYYVFVVNLVASVVTMLLLSNELKKVRWIFDNSICVGLLRYGAPLILVGTAGIINDTFDRIMIKNLSQGSLDNRNELVGLYAAGIKVSVVITMFIQAFRMGAEPYFFKNADKQNSRSLYAEVMNVFVVLVCFIFLINCLYIDVWKLLIDERYYAGLVVVPIASLGRIFLGIYYNQSIWYKNTKQTTIGAAIACAGAIITLLLNYFLIPKIGYLGAAISSTCTYFLMMLCSYFIGQKYYPIPYQLLKITSIFTWTIALFIVFTVSKSILFKSFEIQNTFISIVLATVVLVLFVLIMYQMHFKEYVDTILNKKKN